MKNKIRLMNKIEQTIIIDMPRYMVGEICSVWEDKQGIRTGKLKIDKRPVVYDKVSNVWRMVA